MKSNKKQDPCKIPAFLILVLILLNLDISFAGQDRDGTWAVEFGRKLWQKSREDLLQQVRDYQREERPQLFHSIGFYRLEKLLESLREASLAEEETINSTKDPIENRVLYRVQKAGLWQIVVLRPFLSQYGGKDIDRMEPSEALELLQTTKKLILREITHLDGYAGNKESLAMAETTLLKLPMGPYEKSLSLLTGRTSPGLFPGVRIYCREVKTGERDRRHPDLEVELKVPNHRPPGIAEMTISYVTHRFSQGVMSGHGGYGLSDDISDDNFPGRLWLYTGLPVQERQNKTTQQRGSLSFSEFHLRQMPISCNYEDKQLNPMNCQGLARGGLDIQILTKISERGRSTWKTSATRPVKVSTSTLERSLFYQVATAFFAPGQDLFTADLLFSTVSESSESSLSLLVWGKTAKHLNCEVER